MMRRFVEMPMTREGGAVEGGGREGSEEEKEEEEEEEVEGVVGSTETTKWYSSPGRTVTGKVSMSRVDVLYLSVTLTCVYEVSVPRHHINNHLH